jgi:hypothetical protein
MVRYILVYCLAFAGTVGVAHGQVVSARAGSGTIGINGMGLENSRELQVSNLPSAYGFPLQRAFLVFPTDSIPSAFETCRLELYAHSGDGDEIDVSIVPNHSNSGGLFDYDFRAPLYMCNPLIVERPGLVSLDVSECMRGVPKTGEALVVRLAVPLYSGSAFANFAPPIPNQERPGTWPGPRLIFSGAVQAEKTSLGGVKGLFR